MLHSKEGDLKILNFILLLNATFQNFAVICCYLKIFSNYFLLSMMCQAVCSFT